VAGEVKSLAQQTAKATGDIGAQIRDIQQAVGQTVAAIAAVSASVSTMSNANRQLTGVLDHQAVEIDQARHDRARISKDGLILPISVTEGLVPPEPWSPWLAAAPSRQPGKPAKVA
jgi:hypothetical protein